PFGALAVEGLHAVNMQRRAARTAIDLHPNRFDTKIGECDPLSPTQHPVRRRLFHAAPSNTAAAATKAAADQDDGAGDGNRTHASSLGSCSSTIELHPRRLKS